MANTKKITSNIDIEILKRIDVILALKQDKNRTELINELLEKYANENQHLIDNYKN